MLAYMGQEFSYANLMAATGAAFRLRWNRARWDGGNVDIMRVYDDRLEAFRRGFDAAGRSYAVLERKAGTNKDDFIAFIKKELDSGRPIIALGIIGPPEACIVTGYRDGGATLLGWNFFQENPEFSRGVRIDDSGYFTTDAWWENPDTVLLMSIGEEEGVKTGTRAILENGLDLLRRPKIVPKVTSTGIDLGSPKHDIAGGQEAYEAWAAAMAEESQFPQGAPLPLLFERLMCQMDAITMVGEGRAYAACFIRDSKRGLDSEAAQLADMTAELFDHESKLAQDMLKILGNAAMSEEQARNIGKSENRGKIVDLIHRCAKLDAQAAEVLGELLKVWPAR